MAAAEKNTGMKLRSCLYQKEASKDGLMQLQTRANYPVDPTY